MTDAAIPLSGPEIEIPSIQFAWRRDGAGWRLFAGRRCFGRVVPDAQYPGMWRSVLATGRLSDMANLSWAQNAVLQVAIRELEWAVRRRRATTPSKCPESGSVFGTTSPRTAMGGVAATP